MVDANILYSAILYPGRRVDIALQLALNNHTLVISTFTKEEIFRKVEQKAPAQLFRVYVFFEQTQYELVQTPADIAPGLFSIRDPDDYPVLYSAIVADVDILITGDKDFAEVRVDKPEILTPARFLEKYAAAT
jgi:predicted nucleic acid-binding protein